MSSIDYPPLVDYCNLGETPRMPTPESIRLRDIVHKHQSRVPGFQATPNQKQFQAFRLFAGAGEPCATPHPAFDGSNQSSLPERTCNGEYGADDPRYRCSS